MTEHRYTLEPYKGTNTRYRCPSCQHRDKTFSRYLDTQTGVHLAPTVGRCNREVNCGYHCTPKQYFQDNRIPPGTGNGKPVQFIPKPRLNPVSFIPFEIFRKSRSGYDKNHFTDFLLRKFDADTTCNLISRYHIGTSKQWRGAVSFTQIDIHGKIRQVKVMDYNPETGKRKKSEHESWKWNYKTGQYELDVNKGDKIYFAGKKILNDWNANFVQCFFGEHLLQGNIKPVAIFESEKTALIASVYFPKYICLATGGKNGCKWTEPDVCKVLRGRIVVLFPDISKPDAKENCYVKWSDKAKKLNRLFPGTRFNISDLLERKATETERQQGLDLADYLIRFDYRAFQQPEQPEHQQQAIEQPQPKEIVQVQEFQQAGEKKQGENNGITRREPETPKPENWTAEITELEQYFETATLPVVPVMLNQCSTITDVHLFLNRHFASVKAQNGNITFLPDLIRLKELKQYLTLNTN